MQLQDFNDINPFTGQNLGSFCKLSLIKKKYIVSVDSFKNAYQVSVRAINLLEGSRFVDINFTEPLGIRHNATPSISAQGAIFNQVVELRIRKDRIEVSQWLMDFVNAEVLVILEDFNGNKKLIGELERPLVLRSAFNRGESILSLQHHLFTIEGITKHLSTWFNGVFSENTSDCSGELGADLYYTADQSGGLVAQVGGELHCWINKNS